MLKARACATAHDGVHVNLDLRAQISTLIHFCLSFGQTRAIGRQHEPLIQSSGWSVENPWVCEIEADLQHFETESCLVISLTDLFFQFFDFFGHLRCTHHESGKSQKQSWQCTAEGCCFSKFTASDAKKIVANRSGTIVGSALVSCPFQPAQMSKTEVEPQDQKLQAKQPL